jgi:hypothetical protein
LVRTRSGIELAYVMKEAPNSRRCSTAGSFSWCDRHGQAADRGRVLTGVPLLELQPVDEPCQLDIGPAIPRVLELTQLGDSEIHRRPTPFGG